MLRQFVLEVWGDFACFTQPELKTERFSYPVITPSAARAIFDSIYMSYDQNSSRALFRWQVRRVEILSPIEYAELSRNEVKGKVDVSKVQRWMKRPSAYTPMLADGRGSEHVLTGRTQRQTLALRAVRYRLHAEIVLYEEDQATRLKVERVFERRARRGQCMRQPYLGCREFSAYFELVTDASSQPIAVTDEIGWMLYDVFDLSRPNSSTAEASVSMFFARIQQGVLEIPPYDSDEVQKSEIGR